jgi:hypothetical protein
VVCKSKCTPCFQTGRHVSRHKPTLYPGGQNDVQCANLRLSRLAVHRFHRHGNMAYKLLP